MHKNKIKCSVNNMIIISLKNNTYLYKKRPCVIVYLVCIETETPGLENCLTQFSATQNSDT